MRTYFRLLVYVIICFSLHVGIPAHVFAAGEFQADYEVNYTVSPAGVTIVTQNITLTNKLTNLYPKSYNILIDSERIKNIIATDEKGAISPSINVKDGKTEIGLEFNTQNAGIGKKTFFTLRYEHGDVAHKNGRIWEILVPGVENDEDLGAYRVSISVPSNFGPVAYLNPAPVNGYWSKEQMIKGGIAAAYGDKQIFSLQLSYYLKNDTVSKKEMEIALPPDTAFQTVAITSLEPTPQTVVRDTDGNWLARYELGPSQKLDIQAVLTINVFLHPKKNWPKQVIEIDQYLKPARYWEIYDAKIASLAQKYTTAREIYDYVVGTLSYDYRRVTENPVRLGAAAILGSPTTAICMEFTDLFIALSRAAGIPAREVVGYAYTTNSKLRPLSLVSDVLHAWPEYYDSERNLWIPVDPTWADTTGGVNYFDTLDFNHIAFAIHGKSSQYPLPAGFYRNDTKSGKDVLVRFQEVGGEEQNVKPLSVDVEFPTKITGGIATKGIIVIRNENEVNIARVSTLVQSRLGNVHISKVEENIPPYGTIRIPITIKPPAFTLVSNGTITVRVDENTTTHTFSVQPIFGLLIPIGGAVLGMTLIILIVMQHRYLWKLIKR